MSAVSSWWWGSGSGAAPVEFDRVLENCTSSNLPSSAPPPITDSLTLSDLIRSSAVPAAHAVKSLRKRLGHANPNVQLLAITVIDVCIKNGGDGFLKEIGARDFSEDCAQILTNPASNREVKEKLKREFQNWALAFEAVPFLAHSELVGNYIRFKAMGIEFPPRDPSATAAMVDSMSAPEWRDSEVCERCRTSFSFTNRKHHCRNCGGVFDAQCSSKKRALAHFGVTEPVRVCDGCERTLTAGPASTSKTALGAGRRNSFSGDNASSSPTKVVLQSGSHHRSATFHSAALPRSTHRYTLSTPSQPASLANQSSTPEDIDLERAIALSLQESNPSQRSTLVSRSAPEHVYPSPLTQAPSKPPEMLGANENDDPALAAAIAASLREAERLSAPQPSAPLPASPVEAVRRPPPKPPLPSYELTPEQTDALYNFSTDVETAAKAGSLHPSNSALNTSHAHVEAIRPLMIRSIDNAERKTQMLREMNDKLSEVVKRYDRLLGEQIMYRTQSSTSSNTIQHTHSVYALPPSMYNPPAPQISSFYSQSVSTQPVPNEPVFSTHGPSSGFGNSTLIQTTGLHSQQPTDPRLPHKTTFQANSTPSVSGDSAYNNPDGAARSHQFAPHDVNSQPYQQASGPPLHAHTELHRSPAPVLSHPTPISPFGNIQPLDAHASASSIAPPAFPHELNSTPAISIQPQASWIESATRVPAHGSVDPWHATRGFVPEAMPHLPARQASNGLVRQFNEQTTAHLAHAGAQQQQHPSATPAVGTQVSSGPSYTPITTYTTPCFPSVPNTEPKWVNQTRAWDDQNQEEVAPLIEL